MKSQPHNKNKRETKRFFSEQHKRSQLFVWQKSKQIINIKGTRILMNRVLIFILIAFILIILEIVNN